MVPFVYSSRALFCFVLCFVLFSSLKESISTKEGKKKKKKAYIIIKPNRTQKIMSSIYCALSMC